MEKKGHWLPFLFFSSLVVLFFYPVFLRGYLPFPGDLLVSYYSPWNTGTPHKAQGIDVVRQLFPWKQFSLQQFFAGRLPFWNPHNFAGTPHLANFQTGVFYPLNSLFMILNSNLAWTAFIILGPLLAACFTYLYLHELKIAPVAAVFSGLSFGFCLYMTVWLQWGNVGHALLWLPASLWLVEKLVKKFTRKHFLFLVLCFVLSILAGYAQATMYLLAVFSAYAFFRRQPRFLITPFLALGLTAFQLLPTLELFSQSARGAYLPDQIAKLLLPPFYLVTTFASDFFGNPASRNYWYPGTYIEKVSYIGVLPLLFGLLAVVLRRRESLTRFWIIVAGVALFFSLNNPIARWFYGLGLPFISTVVYTRLLSIFSFAVAILAGLGLDYWLKRKKPGANKLMLGFGSFYAFLWFFTFAASQIWPDAWWLVHLPVTRRNLILPTLFATVGVACLFIASRWLQIKRLVLTGLVAVTVFDLFFYFHKITPFSSPETIYPETEVIKKLRELASHNRFWGYGSGYIDNNFATALGIFSPDGYDPLFIRRYGELISATAEGEIVAPIPRADVALTPGFGPEAMRQNPFRQRLLNLLGVKYILDKDGHSDTFPPEIYELIWEGNPPAGGGWRIFENKQALPRAFLASRYTVATSQGIVDQIMDPDFDLSKTLVLEETLPNGLTLGDQKEAQVDIVSYQSNQVVVKTTSANPGLLFLSDNYYPGWQAHMDSQSVPPAGGWRTQIYRADYSFRAVYVPEGKHKVVFSYRPDSFKWGLVLSGVTLAVIIIVWLGRRK